MEFAAGADVAVYLNSKMTEEDKRLYAAINQSYHTFHAQIAPRLDAELKKTIPDEFSRKSTIKSYTMHFVHRGVRLSARKYFEEKLQKRIHQSMAEGHLLPQEVMDLIVVFSVTPLAPESLTVVDDSGKPHLQLHDKNIIHHTKFLDSSGDIQKLLEDKRLTGRAKAVAAQVFAETHAEIEQFDHAVNTMGSDDVRRASAKRMNRDTRGMAESGDAVVAESWMLHLYGGRQMEHVKPAFDSQKSKDSFAQILALGLGSLVINAQGTLMSGQDILSATQGIANTIADYDSKINKHLQRDALVRERNLAQVAARHAKNAGNGANAAHAEVESERLQAKQSQLQQELLAQAEKKRLEYEAFMASPQPYSLEPEAQRILGVLGGLASGGSFKAHAAQSLLNAVHGTHELLDMRDEGLKEIGGQLLSAASLYAAAKALGLADSIKTTQQFGNDSLKERSKRIRRQYHTSDTAKQVVDTMLTDNDMALLVAIHTGSPDHCARYAAAMGDTTRLVQKLVNEAMYIKTRIGDCTEAELKALLDDPELKTDPDIKKLNANLAEQDALKAKLADARQALVDEVRQTFDGVPPRRIGKGAGGIAVEKTDVEERVHNTWFQHLGDEFHLRESPKGDKYVSVHSNKYPQLNTSLKTNTPEPELISAISHLNNECGAHEANRKIRKGLHKEAGFSVTEENGVTILKHSEYGIRIPMEGSELDKTHALTKAMKAFGLKKFEQESMLRTLEMAGVEVGHSDTATGKSTLLKLADGSHVTLAPRGYFSADDFAIAQGMLGQISASHANGNGNGSEAAQAAPSSVVEHWKPGKEDNIIVFDANVLRRLSVSRGSNHGKTWVDIVKETAKLPGVTVVVPEVVVFELTGKIPTKGQSGQQRHYKLVDQSYTNDELSKSASAKHIEAFLDSAAYGQVENNGEVTVRGGRNNVVVMSTPEDVDLYRKIHQQVLSAPEAERARKLSDLIYHNDEGEQAIARMVRSMPAANFAVITDDTNYVNKSSNAVRITTQGRPVIYAGTGAYLEAEINASQERYRALAKGMHCEALSLYRVSEDIVRGGQGLKNFSDPIMRYSTRGSDPEDGQEVTIASIIRDAAARSVNGHAGGWAHPALRKSGIAAERARRAEPEEGRVR